MQAARARIQVQNIGQTDHPRQASGEVLPGEGGGADDRRGGQGLKGGVGLRLIGRMRRDEDGGLGLRGRACGNSWGGRMRFDDPHPDEVRI